MPDLPSGSYYQQQPGRPTCFEMVKSGGIKGFCVGMTFGTLAGVVGGLRAGFRGRELIRHVGGMVVQGGGTFGILIAVSMGLRC